MCVCVSVCVRCLYSCKILTDFQISETILSIVQVYYNLQ